MLETFSVRMPSADPNAWQRAIRRVCCALVLASLADDYRHRINWDHQALLVRHFVDVGA